MFRRKVWLLCLLPFVTFAVSAHAYRCAMTVVYDCANNVGLARTGGIFHLVS